MRKISIVLLGLMMALTAMAITPHCVVPLYTSTPKPGNGYTDEDEYTIEGPRIFNIATPRMDIYLPEGMDQPVAALLAIPGGGYEYASCGNEGMDVARYFCARGLAVAVLKYRMPNHHPNIPLADACRAMEIMRDSAQTWGIDPHWVGVIGFSAGGHLAASLLTKYTSAKTRPDFGVLVYPVISSDPTIWHQGSFDFLLGEKASKQQYQSWSMERQVTETTPPCVIVACQDDEVVPVENSVRMFQALSSHHVRASLVVVPQGGHGWGFLRPLPQRELIDNAILQFIFNE